MLTISHKSSAYKIISSAGKALLQVTESVLNCFTDTSPVMNPPDFPWTGSIEENTNLIIRELNQILEEPGSIPFFEELSEEQRRIVNPRKWKTYFLYAYGHKIKKNTARCPKTTALAESIPGMMTAFFSILEPGTHISIHRGLYKGVLRYHLGLIIPTDSSRCYLKIDDKKYFWEKGKSFVFDDTFPHEAHNETGERRVVLFVDFKRKFPFPVNGMNNAILFLMKHSPFVTNGVKKIG